MGGHKDGHTATGCMGTVSWEISGTHLKYDYGRKIPWADACVHKPDFPVCIDPVT